MLSFLSLTTSPLVLSATIAQCRDHDALTTNTPMLIQWYHLLTLDLKQACYQCVLMP